MAIINMDAISAKCKAWSETPEGKARMNAVVKEYAANGVSKTGCGGKVLTESDMWGAAARLIRVLQSTAQSYDLPDSIQKHFDSLECSKPYALPDGTVEMYIYFEDDLHRDSLYSEGYDGVDNIVAVLNNGYNARNYVYGWWDNHSPTGDNSYRSGGFNSKDAWVRSKKERTGLHFIQQAVQDFNGNYGYDYNVTAIVGDDYNE